MSAEVEGFRAPADGPGVRRERAGRYGTPDSYGPNGRWLIQSPVPGRRLLVIAGNGLGWEHVSVSVFGKPGRTPTWAEMEHVRLLFWSPDTTVAQLHVPREDWVNEHPGCLHMWRKAGENWERPPALFVGRRLREEVGRG